MSILGLGIDIVNIKRIENILRKNKKNFFNKILHKDEKKLKKLTSNVVSKKFAAKEAFAKAIGTGIGKNIKFNEICINHTKSGAPKIKLDKGVKKRILIRLKIKKANFFLSITDDYPFAVATVIIST